MTSAFYPAQLLTERDHYFAKLDAKMPQVDATTAKANDMIRKLEGEIEKEEKEKECQGREESKEK